MFLFHKSSINWLPVNIMGDELSLQSWIFDMFMLDRTIEDKNSLKSLEFKFGLSSEFSEYCDK